MSILSYFAQVEDKMLLSLLEFRWPVWELSINTILIVDHWTCIWYHWAGVSWYGRMNHNIIFWVCCYLILSLSLSQCIFFSNFQNTKCRRRLSEAEEKTRLFCVNKELMTLIDTTPFCNLFSNCLSKMLPYHLDRLVPISIMN